MLRIPLYFYHTHILCHDIMQPLDSKRLLSNYEMRIPVRPYLNTIFSLKSSDMLVSLSNLNVILLSTALLIIYSTSPFATITAEADTISTNVVLMLNKAGFVTQRGHYTNIYCILKNSRGNLLSNIHFKYVCI